MVNDTYKVCKSDGGNNKCVRGGEQYGVVLKLWIFKISIVDWSIKEAGGDGYHLPLLHDSTLRREPSCICGLPWDKGQDIGD